jgi:hypothetical protein
MKKLFLSISIVFALLSQLHSNEYPNIAVVHTDADNQIFMSVTEKAAANVFYQNYSDVFDFLIFYTTFVPMLNMQQGLPVTYTVEGINREGANPYGPASAWGSGGRLIGAAKMCHIDQYPDFPDDQMPSVMLRGLTSIELLAHEMSHYWHAAMNFRKEGMTEDHTGLRGWEDGANQHWSSDFASGPSVMYGHDIVDNEDGTFTFHYDTPRKFGHLDQYVMGLRPPEEVDDMFFLCGSSNIDSCMESSAGMPGAKNRAPYTREGSNKHIVTIDDIIRAMGERKPHYNEAPKHFNVGFVLINKPGIMPFPQQLEKLERIRVRFQEWWSWATDGRSTICTRLDGDCSSEHNEEPDEYEIVDEDTNEYPDETTIIPDDEPVVEQPDENEVPDDSVEVNDPKPDEKAEEKDDENLYDIYNDETGCSCGLVY